MPSTRSSQRLAARAAPERDPDLTGTDAGDDDDDATVVVTRRSARHQQDAADETMGTVPNTTTSLAALRQKLAALNGGSTPAAPQDVDLSQALERLAGEWGRLGPGPALLELYQNLTSVLHVEAHRKDPGYAQLWLDNGDEEDADDALQFLKHERIGTECSLFYTVRAEFELARGNEEKCASVLAKGRKCRTIAKGGMAQREQAFQAFMAEWRDRTAVATGFLPPAEESSEDGSEDGNTEVVFGGKHAAHDCGGAEISLDATLAADTDAANDSCSSGEIVIGTRTRALTSGGQRGEEDEEDATEIVVCSRRTGHGGRLELSSDDSGEIVVGRRGAASSPQADATQSPRSSDDDDEIVINTAPRNRAVGAASMMEDDEDDDGEGEEEEEEEIVVVRRSARTASGPTDMTEAAYHTSHGSFGGEDETVCHRPQQHHQQPRRVPQVVVADNTEYATTVMQEMEADDTVLAGRAAAHSMPMDAGSDDVTAPAHAPGAAFAAAPMYAAGAGTDAMDFHTAATTMGSNDSQATLQGPVLAGSLAPPPGAAAGHRAAGMRDTGAREVVVGGVTYTKLAKIGSGGSSAVFQVLGPEQRLYALKEVETSDAKLFRSYLNEIALLERLRGCPNIIQLHASATDEAAGMIWLVMECGDVDLQTMLRDRRKAANSIDENHLRLYWQQMLEAVQTIHAHRIVHGDLKPANFIFVRGALKLIDFGIACGIQEDHTSVTRDAQIGTLNYMSPEAIRDASDGQGPPGGARPHMRIGVKSDVWSLGCILYNMVYGKTPFQHLSPLQKIRCIVDPTYAIKFPAVSNPMVLETMQHCLQRDPARRPAIADLLGHAFLNPHMVAAQQQQQQQQQPAMTQQQLHLILQQMALPGSPGRLSQQIFAKIQQQQQQQGQSGAAAPAAIAPMRRGAAGAKASGRSYVSAEPLMSSSLRGGAAAKKAPSAVSSAPAPAAPRPLAMLDPNALLSAQQTLKPVAQSQSAKYMRQPEQKAAPMDLGALIKQGLSEKYRHALPQDITEEHTSSEWGEL